MADRRFFNRPEGGRLISESQRHTTFQPVTDHQERVVRLLNDGLARRGVGIEFTLPARMKEPGHLRGDTKCQEYMTYMDAGMHPDGILHDSQIETTCDTIKQILDNPTKCIVILGMMQCGKTGTAHGCHFVTPILYLLRGIKYYPISLTTNRKGQTEQTRDEYEMFLALYGGLEIRATEPKKANKVISLNAYRDMAMSLKIYQNEIMRGMLEDQIEIDPSVVDPRNQHVERTNNPRRIENIRKLCREAKRLGFKVLLIIDEVHWGAGCSTTIDEQEHGGVMDRMLSAIHANLKDEDDAHIFIGLSATPYALLFLDRVHVIYHRLGDGFCGANFFNGEVIDPDANTVMPRLASFADQGDRWHIPYLDGIDPNRFKDQYAYEKWCKKYKCEVSWETYRTRCIKSMANAITIALQDGAVCLRFINNNSTMGDVDHDGKAITSGSVLHRLQRQLEDVHIVAYNADKAKQKVKTVLRPLIKKAKRILIVVTGAARMADAFPANVRTFLDFTNKSVHLTALLQGSYGRSHGYGKIVNGVAPMVVMSDANVEALTGWIGQKGRMTQSVSHDTMQTLGRSSNRVRQLTVGEKMGDSKVDAVLTKLRQTITDKMDGRLTIVEARNKTFSGDARFVPVWEIVNEEFLTYLEEHVSLLWDDIPGPVRFLRPGPLKETTSEQYDVPNIYIAGLGAVGFRSQVKPGGDDTTTRDRRRLPSRTQPGGRTRGGYLQPQFHIERVGNRWKLVEFVLRLETEARRIVFSTVVMPIPGKTTHAKMLNPDEHERVSAQVKSRRRPRRR